jgi:16S rRNA (cytosine1402-N4)-methyltransferase
MGPVIVTPVKVAMHVGDAGGSLGTYDTEYHAPVMVEEVLEHLVADTRGVYVDGTAGGGGHIAALLDALQPAGRVVGIDRDPEAIEACRKRFEDADEQRLTLRRGNFDQAVEICDQLGLLPVDGFLVDAGVSSRQFDDPDRGFSFREPGPLDMRMGPNARRLDTWLASVEHGELAEVLREYGDVPRAGAMAGAILDAFEAGDLETTTDLRDVVDATGTGARRQVSEASLVFQALRIALNDELRHLREAVRRLPELVRSGGRAVFISFHSLEDRIVKHEFRALAEDCVCPPGLPVCGCDARQQVEILTRSPVEPTEDEVAQNPRARSAKLRAVEVV